MTVVHILKEFNTEDEYLSELKNNIRFAQHMPIKLLSNKVFVLKALDVLGKEADNFLLATKGTGAFPRKPMALYKNFNTFFKNLSVDLRDDKDIVLKVVSKYGDAIEHVSERLRDDRDVVLAAVQNPHYEFLLQFISPELRHDDEIIHLALKNSEYTIENAPEDIRDDKKIALEAVKMQGFVFKSLSERLKNDKEVALVAIKQDFNIYWHFSQEIKDELKENGKIAFEEIIKYLEIITVKEDLQINLSSNNSCQKKIKI